MPCASVSPSSSGRNPDEGRSIFVTSSTESTRPSSRVSTQTMNPGLSLFGRRASRSSIRAAVASHANAVLSERRRLPAWQGFIAMSAVAVLRHARGRWTQPSPEASPRRQETGKCGVTVPARATSLRAQQWSVRPSQTARPCAIRVHARPSRSSRSQARLPSRQCSGRDRQRAGAR